VSAYEDEVVDRCASAIIDYLVAYGPQRRSVIRREVLTPLREELEPAYKGGLLDSVIERRAFEKLARERRAELLELWYAVPPVVAAVERVLRG
jgi:hypothetical protein